MLRFSIDEPVIVLGTLEKIHYMTASKDIETRFPKGKVALLSGSKGNKIYAIPNVTGSSSRDFGKKKMNKAHRLYKRWAHYNATLEVDIKRPNAKFWDRIGKVISLIYVSDKFDKDATRYIHTFKVPTYLYAGKKTKTGKALYNVFMIKPLRITRRGIEDARK